MTDSSAMTIRAKKLGVLIRDSRLATGKSIEECANAIGVNPSVFTEYEYGAVSPSLPELELLAYYLDVSLDHYWGGKSISEDVNYPRLLDHEQLIGLRERMIGSLIKQARTEADLSLDELAERVGTTSSRLEAYELGQTAISLPMLEALGTELNRPIQDFQDKHGPVGVWVKRQSAAQDFLELSPELQAFVTKPINRPYLELAKRLSEMSVERLRAVGEGILEITL